MKLLSDDATNDKTGGNEKNVVSWYLSVETALAILIAVLTIFILTVITNDKQKSFNKLTLLPYYFVLAYAAIEIVQASLSRIQEDDTSLPITDVILQIIINKILILQTALAIQVFEWLNAWLIM